ncbi:MAG TPA: helix-turn-helix transcriptional regulator [Chitinophagaceae bacterium]|nr:helix-turn-helix transcriptional regulator [Chitinophagaceae bacterium]
MDTSVAFPKAKGYPHHPKTIGEHIRKVRMDKGLLQAEVAAVLGVTEQCVTNWENGNGEPQIRYMPQIISFLGYYPLLSDLEIFGNKIKFYRQEKGLSHKRFAKLIGVDAGTISSWENGKNRPLRKHLKTLEDIMIVYEH